MAMSADICGFCFIKSVFGFCENSSLRLCDTCFTVHKKASGHITFPLDKTFAETEEHVGLKSDIHEQKCSTHNTENLSFYCETHDKPVCGRCIIMNHSSCLKNVIDLHEISFNEHQTNEHLSRLDEVKEEIQELEASVMEKMKTVDDLKETYLTGIKIFRKKLDDRLNMLQSKIESAGKSKCDAIVDKLQNIGDECKEINTRIDKKRTMMEELLSNKHDRSLFIISKGLDKEIKEINAVLRQAKLDNHVVEFGFVENLSLDKTLHNDIQEFGTLQETCDGSEMESGITPEVEVIAEEANPRPSSGVHISKSPPVLTTVGSVKDGSVFRFKECGKTWGYSLARKDTIAVEVNEDIVLTHVYIYGNCNENGKMEVSVSLVDDSQTEPLSFSKVELMCEVRHSTGWYEVVVGHDERSYGMQINAGVVYHIVVEIKGTKSYYESYYGKNGETNVISDGITFSFKKSSYSTNNTNVAKGQIAGLKYRTISNE